MATSSSIHSLHPSLFSAQLSLKQQHEGLRLLNHGKCVPTTSVTTKGRSGENIKECVTRAVATPIKPPVATPAKRSKVEIFKEESDFLRYPLLDELKNDLPNVSAASEQLIKFHGSYQQDDRENRQFGQGKAYQFMMRTKQPGGKVSNQLYLVMDDLAEKYGNGSLRLTTRQTFQLHGVIKENLKTVFSTVIHNMGSTLGACGDLNRNVLAPAVPYTNKDEYNFAQEYADKLAMLFAPQSGAYYDVWVDGEKVMTAEEPEDVVRAREDNTFGTNFVGSPEPIYGTQFLPRKFKIALTVPGDNSVDLFTNDLGLVVLCSDPDPVTGKKELLGFNIYVGGGMGRTHRNESTFPTISVPLGYVSKEDVLLACKAVLVTQRDYGRRDDRKQSRLKYLINSWGIDKFRTVCEQYFGKSFEPVKPLPEWQFQHYVGWGEQGDGLLYYGLHVENGRVKGEMKRALRSVIEKYGIPLRITANQNLILCDVKKSWKSRINQMLAPVGFMGAQYVDPLNLTAMACPALPLCGLAVTEAERGLPDVLRRIRESLDKVGLRRRSDTLVVRMTGCPNGCARPYMSELGFVGDGPNSYQIWVGGNPNQTRLASLFLEKVKLDTFENELFLPLFSLWKAHRKDKEEPFGDFAVRVGFENLKNMMSELKLKGTPAARRTSSTSTTSARLSIRPSLMSRVSQVAEERGVSTSVLVSEAIEEFLKMKGEEATEIDVGI